MRTAVAVALGSALFAVPAYAGNPVQFSTVTGDCASGGTSVTGPPVSSPHADILTRYTLTAGTASLDFNSVAAGDVIWAPWVSALDTSDTPSVFAACASPQAFKAEFFDVPETPAAFDGVGNTSGNILRFNAPATGQYVADLTVSGGGVSVDDGAGTGPVTLLTSGQYPLGTIGTGFHDLMIGAVAGPRPAWSVTIRALPVAITDLTFVQTATRPGAIIQAEYTATGDTSVSAVVRDANGQTVKTLATAVPVSEGGNALPWDATNDAGLPLADGPYSLEVDSLDLTGQAGSATTPIVVDGTAPSVTVTSGTTITTAGAVTGQIADALTGVATANLSDSGTGAQIQLPPDQATFTYKPAGGFRTGPQSIVISATDGAGNARMLTYAFTVVAGTQATGTKATTPAGKKAKSAPVPFVRCTRSSGVGVTRPQRSPRSCVLGGTLSLTALHWTSWGTGTITGTGIQKRLRSGDRPRKVRVTLFRVAACGSLRFYTRIRTTSSAGATVTRALTRCASR